MKTKTKKRYKLFRIIRFKPRCWAVYIYKGRDTWEQISPEYLYRGHAINWAKRFNITLEYETTNVSRKNLDKTKK